MRLRSLLIVLAITFMGLGFSACTDESEEIAPSPIDVKKAEATTGDKGDNAGQHEVRE